MPVDISTYLLGALADRPYILALSEGEMRLCLQQICQIVLLGAFVAQIALVVLSYEGLRARHLPRATGLLWFAGALFITSALSPAMPLYVSALAACAWVSYRGGRFLALSYEFLVRVPPSALKDWDRRSPRARFASQVVILVPFTDRGRRQILRLAGVLAVTFAAFHISAMPYDSRRGFSVSPGEIGSLAGLLVLSTHRGAALARPLLRRIYRGYCRRVEQKAVAIAASASA